MRTVNFSEARSNLKAVLDQVVDDADVTVITRRDAEDVVVMSLDSWNSWRETLHLMSSPANAKRLLASIAALDAGRGKERSLVQGAVRTKVAEPAPIYKSRRAAPRKAAAKKSPRG